MKKTITIDVNDTGRIDDQILAQLAAARGEPLSMSQTILLTDSVSLLRAIKSELDKQ